MEDTNTFSCRELTTANWDDLVGLFGTHGGDGGCWCMYLRSSRKDFNDNRGDGNRELFREVVGRGKPVGLLAYVGDEPVGWIAFAPREEYPRLNNFRDYKPLDDQPVWAITCFYTAKRVRRQGVTRFLIENAIRVAGEYGAQILEAYPSEPGEKTNDSDIYTGIYQVFIDAGFKEVARRAPTSPIVRYQIH